MTAKFYNVDPALHEFVTVSVLLVGIHQVRCLNGLEAVKLGIHLQRFFYFFLMLKR